MENFIQGKAVTTDTIDTHLQFRKLSESRLLTKLQALSVDSTLTEFEQLARDSVQLFDEFTLNAVGYYYINTEENFPRAKKILELNLELFPNQSNPYDSMGELYFRMEDFKTAERFYKKSIELDPLNRNAHLYLYIMDRI